MKRIISVLALLLLSAPFARPDIVAQWDFNSTAFDSNPTTGTVVPLIGNATPARLGATTTESFTAANGGTDPNVGDNSNWRITQFPAQGTANKSSGVEFRVNTTGYESLTMAWDQQNSATANRYWRIQCSGDGSNFVDHVVIENTLIAAWTNFSVNLIPIAAANNNSNFAVRILSEFQSTATGSGADGYVSVNPVSSYGVAGTLRLDMMTFTGSLIHNWTSMGGIPGANGPVNAAVVDSAGNIYIGGSFTMVGSVFATNIAKWNGNSWIPLGSGISGGSFPVVHALAMSGSDLYVGGRFTTAGGIAASSIAKWDGSSWSALGSGIMNSANGFVYALAISGNDVYAGGQFTTAGGIAATNIAKWSGNSWSALGSGIRSGFGPPAAVYALATSGNDLYAAGQFLTAGENPANRVAKWDGSSWSALAGGIGISPFSDAPVYALVVSGSDLYAGGEFGTAINAGEVQVAVNNIAKWNGNSWSALGSGLTGGVGGVQALAILGDDLYAGGRFTTADGITVNRIAKWNGSGWNALGSGMNNDVRTLAVLNNDLLAGGSFTTAGGSSASRVARWSGTNWHTVGASINGVVHALAPSDRDMYVAGEFTTVGGIPANRIAQWNGSSWSALGTGMNGPVFAMTISGNDVYAGGQFTTAGGIAATNIAKWNGNSWSALGSGRNGPVRALTISGGDLYAGGESGTAGGFQTASIARWNGSGWSPVGEGLFWNGGRRRDPTRVSALAVWGNALYAGGDFNVATNGGGAGVTVSGIAKWDGSSWSALASGVSGSSATVEALAVSGSNLYVGGIFTTAGGMPANWIAKWDGSSWSALGSGMNDSVQTLAISGADLYAAGDFTMAGGIAVERIAKWNGANWSALGSGINETVRALAFLSGDLYAGGEFTTAGGKISAYLARAYGERPTLTIQNSGNEVTLSWPSFYHTFVLQQNSNAANTSTWISATYPITTNSATIRATLPHMPASQFFRLKGN